jgi:sterol desaturase/sphingolipid hydroxylase (fatty acid hydroxylase superfamily)
MTPALPLLASALVMTLIVAIRYLAVSGAFAWLTGLRKPRLYNGKKAQIRRELAWSMSAAAIYGIPAGIVAWGWQTHGWTRIYTELADYPLWWWPASVFVYLLLHDSWFYWTHRWMHRPALFRRVHAVHHQSRPPTAWAAMSFHPWESVTGAIVIPALVFLVPIHVSALLTVLSIMTFFGVTNHMGWEIFPRAIVAGPAGKWLITASHHDRHHGDYMCNFGLYFRHWDRLCGTDKGLSGWSGTS